MRFRQLLALIVTWIVTAAIALPIAPQPAGTKTISATTSSSATAIEVPFGNHEFQLEISNAGTATVFLEFGGSGATAAVATGYPILAGQTKVVTLVKGVATHVAAITASGTATVYVTTGQGE